MPPPTPIPPLFPADFFGEFATEQGRVIKRALLVAIATGTAFAAPRESKFLPRLNYLLTGIEVVPREKIKLKLPFLATFFLPAPFGIQSPTEYRLAPQTADFGYQLRRFSFEGREENRRIQRDYENQLVQEEIQRRMEHRRQQTTDDMLRVIARLDQSLKQVGLDAGGLDEFTRREIARRGIDINAPVTDAERRLALAWKIPLELIDRPTLDVQYIDRVFSANPPDP